MTKNYFCHECGQEQGCIGGNTLSLSRHKLSCSYARVPEALPRFGHYCAWNCRNGCQAPDLVHHTNDDVTVMRILRDIYLTATYAERNRSSSVLGKTRPFSEDGLTNAAALAFEDLTGRHRTYKEVIDEACRTKGDSPRAGCCTHCGNYWDGIASHAKQCPHWNGGSC